MIEAERLTPALIVEWETYNDLEPFDEWRADFRAATIVAMLANIHRDTKKRSEPYSPYDFMPYWRKNHDETAGPAPEMTPEESAEHMRQIAIALGGHQVRPQQIPGHFASTPFGTFTQQGGIWQPATST